MLKISQPLLSRYKGNRWLRTALIEAARGAINTKDSALGARYRRVMRHRGHNKAAVAVAHATLWAIYHMVAEGTTYREVGDDYYDRRHQQQITAARSNCSSSC